MSRLAGTTIRCSEVGLVVMKASSRWPSHGTSAEHVSVDMKNRLSRFCAGVDDRSILLDSHLFGHRRDIPQQNPGKC